MNLNSLKELLFSSMGGVIKSIAQVLPNILGALFILLLGWVLARSISFILAKLMQRLGLDRLVENPPLNRYYEQAQIKTPPSKVIRKLIYWTIYLLFISTAAEAAGLKVVSEEFAKLITWVPRLFSALLIFGIGLYIISFIRDFIQVASTSLGLSTGKFIANFVFYFLLITLSLTTLKQAGITTDIIDTNLSIILGSIFLAFAIGYGLASREVLSNILAGFFSKKIYQIGQEIELEEIRGTIIEINSISVRLENEEGEVIVPTQDLISHRVKVHSTNFPSKSTSIEPESQS